MNLKRTDFFWIIPASLALGTSLSSLQPGNWWIGFTSFTFLCLLSLSLFTVALRWTTSSSNTGKILAWILAITFALRLLVGVSLYVFLPIYGHDSVDNQAGFAFTDSHRRDDEAWGLATADRPILDAFSQKFAYDQYGGLLAFSALVYRYLSPDAHRPLMLILFSAIVAALGIPFMWKAVKRIFGERVAWVSAWIFALYPESILLGSSAMREPYLLTFSAMALFGFVQWRESVPNTSDENTHATRSVFANGLVWLGPSLLGMLLVSPAIALATLIILAGWIWFTGERAAISWKAILAFAVVFVAGIFILSASLNRTGEFNTSSPLNVINNWLKLAVNWNVYHIERDSGWVQLLFDQMPEWMRLPFVAIYGILQPVLPAALVAPTEPIWKAIYILRSLGWYALLPVLILSFGAVSGQKTKAKRNLILWFSLLTWIWILLAALRGGGDMWDNPRYRTILFLWQAILVGVVWVWWREKHSAWFMRVIICEVVFLLVFTQWYISRYFHRGGQLPFIGLIALILGLWMAILGTGWWRDRIRAKDA